MIGIVRDDDTLFLDGFSYKTRVIAQSYLAPDDFYAALMRIPSFVLSAGC